MSGLTDTRAMLVLGMHRSGTSAVARSLNLLGADVGGAHLPPRPDNPTGFWEHAGVVRIHEQILHALGSAWDATHALPAGWERSGEVQPGRAELVSLLESEFGGKPLWAVKDPRLSLLAPLWLEILGERGCQPSFVIVVRDPREVAHSLRVRSGMPASRSHVLWLRHTLSALAASEGHPRAILAYADLLADWRSEVDRLSQALAVAWPARESAAAELDAFVSSGMRHHVAAGELASDPAVPEWLRRAWAAVRAPAVDAGALARIDAELAAADALLGPELRAREAAIADLAERQTQATTRVEELEARETRLEARLEVAGKETASLRSGNEALERDLAAARGALEERGGELGRLREELAAARESVLEARERHGGLRADLARRAEQVEALGAEVAELRAEVERQAERAGSHESRVRELGLELDGARAALAAQQSESRELAGELGRARRDLGKRADELLERDRALTEAAERRRGMQDELVEVRTELLQLEQDVAKLRASRSWRFTEPLRWLERSLGQDDAGDDCGPDQSEVQPGGELLPGKPVRQYFRAPVRELATFGLYFFTYHHVNSSRVRVRLLEQRLGSRERVLHEVVLADEQVADGRVSLVELPRPVRRANNRRLVCEVESVDGVTGKTVAVGYSPSYYPDARITGATEVAESHVLAIEFNPPPRCDRNKTFAFVSGCPGDAFRYRCEHQAEALRFAGYSVDVFPANSFPWSGLLRDYQVVVAHRVPHTKDFEKFAVRARDAGIELVFDSDDLVFDPDRVDEIDAVKQMTRDERQLFLTGVKRYRRSLELCGLASMSTEALQRSSRDVFPDKPVAVHRNCVSEDMRDLAEQALARPKPAVRALRLAYFSGTNTHRRDFAECVPAVARILEEFPDTRLVLAGHIEVPEELSAFASRIEQHPFMDWRRLPALYREIDVNLAPLEPGSRFTEAKSELKYFEAALLEVPTVASRVGAFEVAIEHGKNGFLCETQDEWTEAIRALVSDASLRRDMGARAHADVEARYTTRAASAGLAVQWAALAGNAASRGRKLRVAWVLRAPIAQTGGGYKKIFQIANSLADRGHEVDLYVEPIAHLKGLSDDEIVDFCHQHFGRSSARIAVGHDDIRSSDVAVATNWPTAQVVDRLENSTLKVYFVQDYEPSFYPETDPLYAAAEETYDLPLRVISIGRYLADILGTRNHIAYPHVDFALEEPFFEDRERVEAKLAAMAAKSDCSILFFARPEIPRRCFQLGVEALERLHAARPDVAIRLYGMEEDRELPFSYENLQLLEQREVASAMRDADICLSFSATNASTVMFEAMASGSTAVELDQPGVRALLDDPDTCVLVQNDPDATAAALLELVGDPRRRAAVARRGYDSVRNLTIENMASQFENHLLEAMLGGRSFRAD